MNNNLTFSEALNLMASDLNTKKSLSDKAKKILKTRATLIKGEVKARLRGSYNGSGKLIRSVTSFPRRKGMTQVIGFKQSHPYSGAVAHLIDLGTKNRTTRNGRNTGAVRARNFYRPVIQKGRRELDVDIRRLIRKTFD